MKKSTTNALAKQLFCGCLLLAATGATGARAEEPLSIAGRGGTLGAGVELKYSFHEKFSGRLVVNQLDGEFDDTDSDISYTGDLELSTYGLIGDWHPAGNGFRLSAGVLANGNQFNIRASGEFEIGDSSDDYTGNIAAKADWKSLAPYVGLGWSSRKARGLSFDCEIGALFQDDIRLSVSGGVTEVGGQPLVCDFSINDKGNVTVSGGGVCQGSGLADALETDLEEEYHDLRGGSGDFDIYPVLSFGIQYNF